MSDIESIAESVLDSVSETGEVDYKDEELDDRDDSLFGTDSSEDEDTRPKKRKQRKKSEKIENNNIARLVAKSKALQRTRDQNVHPATSDDLLPFTDTTTEAPAMKKYRRLPSTLDQLTSPIGFTDSGVFSKRIEESRSKKFTVKRTFYLSHTRYIPFGNTSFYKDPAEFYSQPTSLCCQWCTEQFSNPPFPMPTKYTENIVAKTFFFTVTGQFCSPSCMLSRLFQVKGSYALGRLLLKRMYSVPISKDIQPAPHPHSLKKFGGLYSIDEFRATGMNGITTVLHEVPFLPLAAGLVEVDNVHIEVLEDGGKELVRKRVRGRAYFGNNMIPLNSATIHVQKGRFAHAPTIEDQIAQSDSKYRLQQTAAAKKTGNILDFMKIKST
jgi:hypothetical protein